MVKKIDINCDMGESYGNWRTGNDEEVMKYLTTAQIACGWHAGDANIMESRVEMAKKNSVAVGSHVGLPDLQGFGRREMKISPREAKIFTIYQTGALKAFLDRAGIQLQNVKPHGAFYQALLKSEELSRALAEAILEMNPKLYWYMPVPNLSMKVAREMGVKPVGELYVDMDYAPDGSLLVRREQFLYTADPKEVAQKIIKFVDEGKVKAVDGTDSELDANSVCVHGDTKTAVQELQTIREELKKANVEVVPITQIL